MQCKVTLKKFNVYNASKGNVLMYCKQRQHWKSLAYTCKRKLEKFKVYM